MLKPIDVVEELLRKRKIDQWEIFFQTSMNFRVETKNLEVDFLQKAKLAGMAIRLIIDQKMGFSYTSDLTNLSLQQTVDMAGTIARSSSRDRDHSFPEPDSLPIDETVFFNKDILHTDEQEKIRIARVLEESVFSCDQRVSAVRSSGYSDVSLQVEIRNSNGLRLQGKAGLARMWVELMAQDGTHQEMGYWTEQSRSPKSLDPKKIASTAAQRTLSKLGANTVRSTKCKIILENLVAASFLDTLSNSFLAESQFKATASPRVSIGSQSFSTCLDMTDNALDSRGSHAFPFDGEGVPSRSTTLVKSGQVQCFLADGFHGKKFGLASTGNCRRKAFDIPPSNGITNLFVSPGNLGRSELLEEVGAGLMITEVMGLHTANPISGDFSVGASGFKISGGRLGDPVKGIAIAGNLIDVFGQIMGIGNDLEFFGNVGSPSLIIDNISISGE